MGCATSKPRQQFDGLERASSMVGKSHDALYDSAKELFKKGDYNAAMIEFEACKETLANHTTFTQRQAQLKRSASGMGSFKWGAPTKQEYRKLNYYMQQCEPIRFDRTRS